MPIEEEDKSPHPYISDTDSVSEQHFKFKHGKMDKDKAYCIQVRIVNLLMFWMKEYFMEDFEEANNMKQLEQFIQRIKNLKTRIRLPKLPKLPSIPMYDKRQTINSSDIPTIPSIDEKVSAVYADIIKKNKSNMIIINTSRWTKMKNQSDVDLKEDNDSMIMGPLHLDINDDAHSQRQMDMMHSLITPNVAEESKQCTFAKDEKRMDSVFEVSPMNNAIYIPNNRYYDADIGTVMTPISCIDCDNDCKVMIKNINDYKQMHYKLEAAVVPKTQKQKFKRIKNDNTKAMPIQMGPNQKSKTSEESQEITENIASSDDFKEYSMVRLIFANQ